MICGIAQALRAGNSEPGIAKQEFPAGHDRHFSGSEERAAQAATIALSTIVALLPLWMASGNRSAPVAVWGVRWPENEPGYRVLPMEPSVRHQLRYDSAHQATWSAGKNAVWIGFWFRWEAASGRARLLSHLHKPEHCLPATGWRLKEERKPLVAAVGPVEVRFRVLTYALGSRVAHVYFCHEEDRLSMNENLTSLGETRPEWLSLRALVHREPPRGQQIAEFVLGGLEDGAEADARFVGDIVPLLRPAGP
jgi:hypothetical protein